MVVAMPAGNTEVRPAAHIAMFDRFRICAGDGSRAHSIFQVRLREAVIRREISDGVRMAGRVPDDYVHSLRWSPLDSRDVPRVCAHLYKRIRPNTPGEFRSGDFVGVASEITIFVDAKEEVGPAVPTPIEEASLVYDASTVTHRLDRRRFGSMQPLDGAIVQ